MRLLVPVDGSAASHRAVEHAVWLAQGRAGAGIVLLNVQNRDTLGLSEIDADAGNEVAIAAEHSEKVLHAAAMVCEKAGLSFETRAEFGPVGETILRVAHECHADQIIMGSRGLGRVRAMLLGSVATEVIQAAGIPVTVVKRGTRLPGHGAAESTDGSPAG